jgi:glycosyltransferase involved in cell wall biosynthesis
MMKKHINWYGPFNSLGYGQASMGYALGLHNSLSIDKQTMSFSVIGGCDNKDPELNTVWRQRLSTELDTEPDPSCPTVGFWHFHDLDKVGTGSTRTVLSTFEVDYFPEPVMRKMNELDAIGTASKWGYDILKRRFPSKVVFKAPHAVRTIHGKVTLNLVGVAPKSTDNPAFWANMLGVTNLDKRTQVLSTVGKYEMRKGHIELIDSVLDIGKERPILLVASWFNPFMAQYYPFFAMHERDMRPIPSTLGYFAYVKDKAVIIMLPRLATRSDLHELIGKSDTYVGASYAEGWDLPLFEAMSRGMHCIATLNTAHLDYCFDYNVTPMTQFDTVPAKDDTPYFQGHGTWNKISKEELQNCIDKSFTEGLDYRASIGERAREVCQEFDWTTSSATILNTIGKVETSKTATTK